MKKCAWVAALIFLLLTSADPANAGFFKKKPAALNNETPLEELTPLYDRKVFEPTEKGRRPLTYFWFQPSPPYPAGIKFPVVLILHGASGIAHAGKFLVEPPMQTAYPAFIVVPALTGGSVWANTKPMTLANGKTVQSKGYETLHDAVSLIKDLQTHYPIDPKRIYVMGCSEGGVGTFGAVLHYPDVFAAAVSMSGAWNPEDSPRMTKVPIWALHGGKDSIMPSYLSKDVVTLIHEYGGTAYYTEFPEMEHNCPSPRFYSPEMWEWLFRQIK